MNILKQRFVLLKTWFGKTSLKKKVFIFAIIAVAIWFARPLLFGSEPKPQYQTARAEKGTLIESVSASGTVTSGNSSSVMTQTTGVIKEIMVKNGDSVTAGQPIAIVSPDQNSQQRQAAAYAIYLNAVNAQKTTEQNKVSADATMWQAQQAVLDAQNTVNYKNDNTTNLNTNENYTDLEKQSVDSGLVQAQKAFSANEKQYKEADAAEAAANAQVTSAWLSYQQTMPTILSPISGTVNNLSFQVGSVISSSSTSDNSSSSDSSSSSQASSQKVATIKTDGTSSISVNLSEIDAPKVKIGDKATVTFDAYSGKTFTGNVIGIDTSGSVSSGVTTYPATLTLDSPPEVLYPNMSVSAAIITNTKDNIVMVPTTSVQTQGRESIAKIIKDGKIQLIPVETGLSNDTQIEIVSGITEGETVVTGQTSGATMTGGSNSPFSSFGGRGGGGAGGGAVRIQTK